MYLRSIINKSRLRFVAHALNLFSDDVAVALVICIRNRLNVTNAAMFVVKSEGNTFIKNSSHALNNLLTVNIEIIIPSSSYRNILDEIADASVASIRLKIGECQREVHRFILQAELYIIDAKSINAIN